MTYIYLSLVREYSIFVVCIQNIKIFQLSTAVVWHNINIMILADGCSVLELRIS